MLAPSGPYADALQLPKVFVPGLRASPWHEVEVEEAEVGARAGAGAGAVTVMGAHRASVFPGLRGLRDLLVTSHGALSAEARVLRSAGLFEREEECIFDPSRSGGWVTLNVNGDTHAPEGTLDADGCSRAAPVACGVLREARRLAGAQAVRVLRGAYSVIAARAHLHPHCGATNAQLKMHLGLEVPVDPATGLGCARIRVGNETRRWAEGAVLFFDDSFEHEVWHDCTWGAAPRSVFQIVFAHPELPAAVSKGARDPLEL